ncbi:MAG: GNAT family N-acetyltransferase [Bacillota bacterium]
MFDMKEITYCTSGAESLDMVKGLWEKLNEHHLKGSAYFAEYFRKMNFEKRKAALMEKAVSGELNIELAFSGDEAIGYCISTIDEYGIGEIDSIYVLSSHRGCGIGDMLMTRSMDWLNGRKVRQKKLVVAFGNEEVFNFYMKYGLYPRYTILMERED